MTSAPKSLREEVVNEAVGAAWDRGYNAGREAALKEAAHLMDDEGAAKADILSPQAHHETAAYYRAAALIRSLITNPTE